MDIIEELIKTFSPEARLVNLELEENEIQVHIDLGDGKYNHNLEIFTKVGYRWVPTNLYLKGDEDRVKLLASTDMQEAYYGVMYEEGKYKYKPNFTTGKELELMLEKAGIESDNDILGSEEYILDSEYIDQLLAQVDSKIASSMHVKTELIRLSNKLAYIAYAIELNKGLRW